MHTRSSSNDREKIATPAILDARNNDWRQSGSENSSRAGVNSSNAISSSSHSPDTSPSSSSSAVSGSLSLSLASARPRPHPSSPESPESKRIRLDADATTTAVAARSSVRRKLEDPEEGEQQDTRSKRHIRDRQSDEEMPSELSLSNGTSANHGSAPPTSSLSSSSSAAAAATFEETAYPNDGAATIIDKRPTFRSEFVRLMLQSLRRYGYSQSAAMLERESGFTQEESFVADFRKGVLEGDWAKAVALIGKMGFENGDDQVTAKFLIFEQKFLEHLERRELSKALACLRQELTPLSHSAAHLHKLSQLMMCRSSEDLRQKADWSGSSPESRQKLLSALQKYISPTLMIPQHRLETLVEQAVLLQQLNCMYHNTNDAPSTLLADHVCDRNSIPREAHQILQAHFDEVWYIKFSNDGTKLASASKDSNVIIWDVSQPVVKSLHILSGHREPVSFLSWSPDDKWLLTCGNDKKLKLWDVKNGIAKKTIAKHNSHVSSCAWVPDGTCFLSGSVDNKLYLWDLEGTVLEKFENAKITDMAILNDGKRIVAITNDTKVFMYYIHESRKEEIIQESDPITSLSLSKDGNFIILNLASQEIHLWDINKRQLVSKYVGHKQGHFVIRSCFGGENECYVASGSEDNNIYIWHRHHGNLLETLTGHTGTVNTVAWNPRNPRMFASASDDHTIRIWGSAMDSHPRQQWLQQNATAQYRQTNGFHDSLAGSSLSYMPPSSSSSSSASSSSSSSLSLSGTMFSSV